MTNTPSRLVTTRSRSARRVLSVLAMLATLPGLPSPAPGAPPAPLPSVPAPQLPSLPNLIPGPAIPPQPGTQLSPTCGAPSTTAGSVTEVVHQTTATSAPPPSFQIAVDPRHPCVMYRAASAQEIDRSADGGQTWHPVFQDSQPGVTTQQFAASDLQVGTDGAINVAEWQNGDAYVRSSDHGATWTLRDSGMAPQSIDTVTVAPGDPQVVYAVTRLTGHPYGMYVTTDGGGAWTYDALPVPEDPLQGFGVQQRDPQVAIDPYNPAHLWVLVHSNSYGSGLSGYGVPQQLAYVVLESSDYGGSWTVPPALPQMDATQIIASESPTRGLILYLNNQQSTAQGSIPSAWMSVNGGTWQALPVPGLSSSVLISNPANPDEMLYVGRYFSVSAATTERSYVTYDSWRTALEGPAPNGFHQGPFLPNSPLRGASTFDPTVLGQADAFGNFYLLFLDECADATTGRSGPQCYTDEPVGVPFNNGYYQQALYRLTPPLAVSARGPGVPQTAVQLKACPMPLDTAGAAGDQDGALAFDGQALLYTHGYETGAVPLQGVVRRLDPVSCTELPPMLVSFVLADLQTVALTDAYPDEAAHPYVDTVTYDPNDDALWLSLRTGASAGGAAATPGCAVTTCGAESGAASIFYAPIDRVPGQPPTAAAKLAFFLPNDGNGGEGEDLLAYDYSSDRIWAMEPGPEKQAPNFYNSTESAGPVTRYGRANPTCWPVYANGSLAAWTVTGAGRMYVQSEDDITLYEVDDTTCQAVGQFVHRNFGEPSGEDEEIACDSLTFGTTASASHRSPTSAIWIRDAINQLAVAYAIPDGVCPFPTVTKYTGAFTALRGSRTQLCAQLDLRGTGLPLAQLPVDLVLNGRDVGAATTDGLGRGCVTTTVSLGAGSYPVKARFAGDNRYLPSAGAGVLTVTEPAPPPPPLSTHGGTPRLRFFAVDVVPPEPPSLPAPTTQLQLIEQAQSQSSTVAQLQPGLMTQRQERTQVAAQRQRAATPQMAYQAVSLRRTSPAPAIAFAAGLMMFGLGLVARRPRLALARRLRRRY